VLTIHRSGSPLSVVPQAISWHWILPVTVEERSGRLAQSRRRARSGHAATRSARCPPERAGPLRRRSPWHGRIRGTRRSAAHQPHRPQRADRPGRSRPTMSTRLPRAPEETARCGGTESPCPARHPTGASTGLPSRRLRSWSKGPAHGPADSLQHQRVPANHAAARSATRGEGESRPDPERAGPLEPSHSGPGRPQRDRGRPGRCHVLHRPLQP
jgi:hypothetical protein